MPVCVCECVCATCLSLRLSLCLCQVVFPTQAGHLRSEASFKILCSFHVAHIRDTHCTLTHIQMPLCECMCVCICVWGQPLLSRESHPVCPEPVSASNEFPCSCRCASFFLSVLLYLILQVLRCLLCLLLLFPVCRFFLLASLEHLCRPSCCYAQFCWPKIASSINKTSLNCWHEIIKN